MNKIRLRYSKTGRAKFLSHLDFTATMQRVFLRAGIKLKYSEGFNPHPFLSVALPLSVGYGSVCELMDIAVLTDELPDLETARLPDGIEILEIYKSERKFCDIQWIEVQGGLFWEKQISQGLINDLDEVYKKESIIIQKRSKRGIKELNIKSHIRNVRFSENDGSMTISAQISAQNPTLNVEDLLGGIDVKLRPEHTDINRVGFYDKDMIQFK